MPLNAPMDKCDHQFRAVTARELHVLLKDRQSLFSILLGPILEVQLGDRPVATPVRELARRIRVGVRPERVGGDGELGPFDLQDPWARLFPGRTRADGNHAGLRYLLDRPDSARKPLVKGVVVRSHQDIEAGGSERLEVTHRAIELDASLRRSGGLLGIYRELEVADGEIEALQQGRDFGIRQAKVISASAPCAA